MQKNGIVKLGYDPAIQMSTDDWENFSLHGLLLNEDQELDRESFELAMRFQLADYSQVFLPWKWIYKFFGRKRIYIVWWCVRVGKCGR